MQFTSFHPCTMPESMNINCPLIATLSLVARRLIDQRCPNNHFSCRAKKYTLLSRSVTPIFSEHRQKVNSLSGFYNTRNITLSHSPDKPLSIWVNVNSVIYNPPLTRIFALAAAAAALVKFQLATAARAWWIENLLDHRLAISIGPQKVISQFSRALRYAAKSKHTLIDFFLRSARSLARNHFED